jgi:hypothetical protein
MTTVSTIVSCVQNKSVRSFNACMLSCQQLIYNNCSCVRDVRISLFVLALLITIDLLCGISRVVKKNSDVWDVAPSRTVNMKRHKLFNRLNGVTHQQAEFF